MEEDNLITKYYSKFGRNWALIAKKLKGRSGKQVRERFINYLEKKELSKEDLFTAEEDELILRYFDIHPHDWTKIARLIPNKNASSIKQRYQKTLKL
mmetsp:Transcript_16559/g.15856  ORF Transcript_16559/g.15856 Transcript_16559/m.15856 type:complete len:97 (+) Transcript_16559:119-409(+)